MTTVKGTVGRLALPILLFAAIALASSHLLSPWTSVSAERARTVKVGADPWPNSKCCYMPVKVGCCPGCAAPNVFLNCVPNTFVKGQCVRNGYSECANSNGECGNGSPEDYCSQPARNLTVNVRKCTFTGEEAVVDNILCQTGWKRCPWTTLDPPQSTETINITACNAAGVAPETKCNPGEATPCN
jgi:hypothetical protein